LILVVLILLTYEIWCYALLNVALIINYIPTPLLNDISLYEKLRGKCYDTTNMRVFGCLCYVNIIIANRNKLENRADPEIFIGFKPNTKGYMFLNLKTHKIEVSRHIIFMKIVFCTSLIMTLN